MARSGDFKVPGPVGEGRFRYGFPRARPGEGATFVIHGLTGRILQGSAGNRRLPKYMIDKGIHVVSYDPPQLVDAMSFVAGLLPTRESEHVVEDFAIGPAIDFEKTGSAEALGVAEAIWAELHKVSGTVDELRTDARDQRAQLAAAHRAAADERRRVDALRDLGERLSQELHTVRERLTAVETAARSATEAAHTAAADRAQLRAVERAAPMPLSKRTAWTGLTAGIAAAVAAMVDVATHTALALTVPFASVAFAAAAFILTDVRPTRK